MKIQYLFIFTISIQMVLVISCDGSPTTMNGNESSENTNNNDPGNDKDKEWQLVWSDEFDSDQLDMDKWSFQFGTGGAEGLQGWGNNELQYYTDREENVFIQDGNLHIVAQKEIYEGMEYTSGRIRTIGKGDWVYQLQ